MRRIKELRAEAMAAGTVGDYDTYEANMSLADELEAALGASW